LLSLLVVEAGGEKKEKMKNIFSQLEKPKR